MKKLPPQEHRRRGPTPEEAAAIIRHPLTFVLDNVIDTYNIGALFRLADAAAAEKIYLCGQTPTPPNPRIHKAAVGTERWVPWEHRTDTVELLKALRMLDDKLKIIAVEQHPQSISYAQLPPSLPAALILGHETNGISTRVLAQADLIVELPMYGVTRSLNLAMSAAVVVYKLLEDQQMR